jgi:recombination protein RecR
MAGLPKSVARLINNLESLPGIGPKSATRLAFYFLATPKSYVEELVGNLTQVKEVVNYCEDCFLVIEGNGKCEICLDNKRDTKKICVVERAIDLLSLEQMGGYNGLYHVLGGALNPLEHVGPEDLKISELVSRVTAGMEIILATNPTMEGEATALYIKKKLEHFGSEITISRIGSGLPIGGDLEFADMATISQAMQGRRSW